MALNILKMVNDAIDDIWQQESSNTDKNYDFSESRKILINAITNIASMRQSLLELIKENDRIKSELSQWDEASVIQYKAKIDGIFESLATTLEETRLLMFPLEIKYLNLTKH